MSRMDPRVIAWRKRAIPNDEARHPLQEAKNVLLDESACDSHIDMWLQWRKTKQHKFAIEGDPGGIEGFKAKVKLKHYMALGIHKVPEEGEGPTTILCD